MAKEFFLQFAKYIFFAVKAPPRETNLFELLIPVRSFFLFFCFLCTRDRTHDLELARQAIMQLSPAPLLPPYSCFQVVCVTLLSVPEPDMLALHYPTPFAERL